MRAGPKEVRRVQTIQAGCSRFQYVLTHEQTECKVILVYTSEANNSCELKVVIC
jgi:hypothetical protein